ncbi:MAG TPA: hypothetical protein VNA68_00375 [Candidatus Dormibacteraeota bacterium]|nr:hypothetical protein [Candidatus Dormibacteraeota bacterium]
MRRIVIIIGLLALPATVSAQDNLQAANASGGQGSVQAATLQPAPSSLQASQNAPGAQQTAGSEALQSPASGEQIKIYMQGEVESSSDAPADETPEYWILLIPLVLVGLYITARRLHHI